MGPLPVRRLVLVDVSMTDPLDTFKAAQRAGWAHFSACRRSPPNTAAHLVRFAGITAGQRVLDVACGTGVASVTAARLGATVTELNTTPELLAAARDNGRTAAVDVEWHEGDAESLPFEHGAFDVVSASSATCSRRGPTWPRCARCSACSSPAASIAFATWPPELFIGRMFTITGPMHPPPPPGVSPPPQWGDPQIVTGAIGDGGQGRSAVRSRDDARTGAESAAFPNDVRTDRRPNYQIGRVALRSDPAKLGRFAARRRRWRQAISATTS